MEFWRIYRLLLAKRWLIGAVALVAFVVILCGTAFQAQNRQYRAEAILQPQDLSSLQQVLAQTGAAPVASADGGDGLATQSSNEAAGGVVDRTASISDLIMLLRSSNDLYLRAAALLQENETDRQRDVERILDRNGFFAPVDSDIAAEGRARIASGDLLPSQLDRWVAQSTKAAREKTVATLARGRDAQGDFAHDGVRLGADEIADRIRDHLSFDTVEGPLSTDTTPQIVNQLKISGEFGREAEADLYVNILCVAFIDFYSEQSAGAANARVALLRDKLAQATDRLSRARNAEVRYREARSDVALVPTGQADPSVQQLYQLETARGQAEQDAQAAAAAASTLQGLLAHEQPVETTLLPPSERPLVTTLEERVADLQAQYDAIANSDQGAENNPRFQDARRTLDAARTQLNAALREPMTRSARNPRYDDLRTQLSAALVRQVDAAERTTELDQQIAAQRNTLATLPAAQAHLADLRREVGIAEKNVADLEYALDRTQLLVVESNPAGTIAIVSQAHATLLDPLSTAGRVKLLLYGTILSLILAGALVIGLDALDNSVRSVRDVEQLLGLPLCGMIPAHNEETSRASRITALDPLSPAAEAYRLLRTDLLFTAEDRPFQSLMVGTGKPGQGATTTISNLAIAFAQAGKRVILIDADLRRPKLHGVFGTTNDVGLTSLLLGDTDIEHALHPTGIDNLLLLPTGPLTMHPSEMLASRQMRQLHEDLKRYADFVLVDTPSAIAFSDATILSSFIDATLMVVRAFNVPRGSEDTVRRMLTKAKANMIGVVLNGVPPSQVDSVHYHYHYYPQLSPKNGGPGTSGMLPAGATPALLQSSFPPTAGYAGTGAVATATDTATDATPSRELPVVTEPFLEERTRSWWSRWHMRAVSGAVALGVVVGGLALALAHGAISSGAAKP
jgi:tyrosine-protein kinase Etk/Wzc